MPCGKCDECLQVEPKLASAFVTALERERFQLSWLYIDLLDECGHARGDSHLSYVGLVRRVDRMQGQVLQALRDSGMLERVAVLVLDHGREASQARRGFTAEMAVQWLLYGPGARHDRPALRIGTSSRRSSSRPTAAAAHIPTHIAARDGCARAACARAHASPCGCLVAWLPGLPGCLVAWLPGCPVADWRVVDCLIPVR